MKQIIISIAGSLLILQALRLIIPEGTIKKYASFIVGMSTVLMLTVSFLGREFSFDIGFGDAESTEYSGGFEDVRQSQIEREFTRQLDTDMKKSIPELKTAELSFSFDISENNTGYVTYMLIRSPDDEDENVKRRVSESYMIPREVIEWIKT